MRIIVDRFEGEYAVVELENRQFLHIPRRLLPGGAAEGTVLDVLINERETRERKESISKRMAELRNE
jgi:hypothetical protein